MEPPRSLVVFNDPTVYELSPSEEDDKYGPLEAHIQKWEGILLKGVGDEDRKYCIRKTDFSWDGWKAEFIASKQSTRRKMNHNGALMEDDSDDDSEDEIGDDPVATKFRKEYAVAMLAYEVILHYMSWPEFKSVFGEHVHDSLQDRLFQVAVKLVLSIFDEEDFVRICYRYQIRNEHSDFHEELFGKVKDGLPEAISNDLWKFKHLWESDIYDALHQHVHDYKFKGLKVKKFKLAECLMNHRYVQMALEVMKKHVPLKVSNLRRLEQKKELITYQHLPKGNIKAQLLLEHLDLKCFHVTDALVLQAMHDVGLSSLLGDSTNNEEKVIMLSELADEVLNGFNALHVTKAKQMIFVEDCMTDPAEHDFGPCKPEVTEVIKLANLERIMSNARSIREAHIIRALSLSRVRDVVKKMKIDERMCYKARPSGLYAYELYRLSSSLAKEEKGDDGEWGLEHLVFSLFFGSSKENLKECFYQQSGLFDNLRMCKSTSAVSWRNLDIFTTLLEERCRYGERYTCEGRDVIRKLHGAVGSSNIQLAGHSLYTM